MFDEFNLIINKLDFKKINVSFLGERYITLRYVISNPSVCGQSSVSDDVLNGVRGVESFCIPSV